MPFDVENKIDDEIVRVTKDTITPKDLLSVLDFLLSPVHPVTRQPKSMSSVFVWGPAGIGKTAIINQYANNHGMRCVAIHLPQYDPVDLKGIPVRTDDGSVNWVPSSYLPKQMDHYVDVKEDSDNDFLFEFNLPYCHDIMVVVHEWDGLNTGKCVFRYNDTLIGKHNEAVINTIGAEATVIDAKTQVGLHLPVPGRYKVSLIDKAVLFLDELSAAVPEVQKAALQLVLDRRVGEWDVPVGTPIVAAGNDLEDFANVHQLSAPLDNRFCHLKLVTSSEDWLEYAVSRRIHPDIVSFIHFDASMLSKFDGNALMAGEHGFASPRSWVHLSEQMDSGLGRHIENIIIKGHIGKTVGEAFIIHREHGKNVPDVRAILLGEPVPPFDRNDIPLMHILNIRIAYVFFDLYNKHFENGKLLPGKEDSWRDIVDNYFEFLDQYLSREMISINIWTIFNSPEGRGLYGKMQIGTKAMKFSEKYVNLIIETNNGR